MQVLEKSLNFLQLPMHWPGKNFLMLFGCPRQNINHSSENLKVIYIKWSMSYALINHQFKTSELENVEKFVKQKGSSLQVLLE